jgi:hypothetical protein
MKTKFATFTSEYGADISLGSSDPTHDFDWISLRQAFECFVTKTEPIHEAVKQYQGYARLPKSNSTEALEFVKAAQQKKFRVVGRFCLVKLPQNICTKSPFDTCESLRKSELPLFSKRHVVGAFPFPPDSWQLNGVIWEQNLSIQYNWAGKLCDDLPEDYDKVSDGWKNGEGSSVEYVAFCDISVNRHSFNYFMAEGSEKNKVRSRAYHELEHRRLLLAIKELEIGIEYALENGKQAQMSMNDISRESTSYGARIEVVLKAIDDNNSNLLKAIRAEIAIAEKLKKKRTRAGRPKSFDFEVVFLWLQKRTPEIYIHKMPELQFIVQTEFYREKQAPKVDALRDGIKKLPFGETWLVDHVKTMGR